MQTINRKNLKILKILIVMLNVTLLQKYEEIFEKQTNNSNKKKIISDNAY